MIKVLIVEDDLFLSRMYQKKFEVAGFAVATAADGLEGLTKAREFQPNLILMDVMMPKLNGIQALEELKKDPELKKIPVLMLSNFSNTDDASVAVSKGALEYLVKSDLTPNDVVIKVKEALQAPPK